MARWHKLFMGLALLCSGITCEIAWAHAALKSAIPASGTTLDAPPKQIALHFSERLESEFSSITVTDGGGRITGTAKSRLDPGDSTVMILELPLLTAGAYGVHWRAVGHDGHLRKGDYTFTVK